MAIRQDITSDDNVFAGEDRILEFTLYPPGSVLNEDDGLVYTDKTFATPAQPMDLTGLSLEWVLRATADAAVALITKTTADSSMIVVLDQTTDRGRCRVFINGAIDTKPLADGMYAHAMAETAPEFEVLTDGRFRLKVSAAHR